jgi:HEAT repeat protein
MSEIPPPAPGSGAPEEPPEIPLAPLTAEPRQTVPFLVLQFFLFPLGIVAVCVAVFVVFGLIAGETHTARDYLLEIRSGSANRRWQAAFELSKVLQSGPDKALADPRLAAEALALFQESTKDDPKVRRYLALALGRLGDRKAVPALVEAAKAPAPSGEASDPETRIYAIWSLGALGDPAAVPELAALARDEDAGLRKAAVHALGAFDVPEACEAERAALADAAEDVRWNAALALSRRQDPLAVPVLLQMLDRAHLDTVQGLSGEQREDAILQAVAAAAAIRQPETRAVLERLRDSDPNLKVREAARRALEPAS